MFCAHSHKKRRAFSAIEIVVVLLILSAFSTFAIVSYAGYRKQARIRNASRRLETLLTTARALAINHNTPYQVQIDMDNHQFWVDRLDRFGRIEKPKAVPVDWLPDFVRVHDVVKSGLSYASGTVSILFRPNSTSEYTSIYIISELEDEAAQENYITIRIYPSTGLVKTFRNERR